jgi:hypothetical protein
MVTTTDSITMRPFDDDDFQRIFEKMQNAEKFSPLTKERKNITLSAIKQMIEEIQPSSQ